MEDNILEKIRDYKNYIIIGIIFLLIILLVVVGYKARKDNGEVVDNTLYYIDLFGENNITIYQGEEYIEPGYRGRDDNGKNVTDKIEIIKDINIDEIGAYKVIYKLNNITKERVVNVIKKEPGSTYIHLYGDVNVLLYVGDKYIEKNCEVVDTVDGNKLKDKLVIDGSVDTSKAGIYKITYSVTNSSGITTSAVRTVVVMDSDLTVVVNDTNYTSGKVKINVYTNDDLFDYLLLPDGNKVKEQVYTYEVSENGTYKFVMYNTKGISKEKSTTVNTIDRTKPSGSCSGSYKEGKTTINVSANDNVGIASYEIDGVKYTNNKIVLDKEVAQVKITINDMVGNKNDISCNLEDKNIVGNIANIDNRYKPKYIVNNNNVSVNYYGNGGFSYWVYLPDKVKAGLPIVMYMGGLGERGNDYKNSSKIAINNGPIAEVVNHGYKYEAIIVHMEVPGDTYVYGYLDTYVELLNKIADEFKANKKKISVMGFSHGCYGVMNIMIKYQTYFSAAVPIGCSPNDRAYAFKYTPTWSFVGGGDGQHSLPGFVDQINALGGTAKHSQVSHKSHDIVGASYSILRDNQYNVIEWMTSQTRS